jgi:tyrosine-protein kinase Etk/Wzc
MPELIAELRASYDIVLIDSPPILQVPDARVLGKTADAAILVFKAGSTSMDTAAASRARFEEDGIRILGCILNNWNPKVGGYGQGYYGAYYGTYYQHYSQRADD